MKDLTVEAWIKALACVGMIIIMIAFVYSSMEPAMQEPPDMIEQLEQRRRNN